MAASLSCLGKIPIKLLEHGIFICPCVFCFSFRWVICLSAHRREPLHSSSPQQSCKLHSSSCQHFTNKCLWSRRKGTNEPWQRCMEVHLRSPLSRIPDSCRERMQESTNSKPVVSSSSMSFCPSAGKGGENWMSHTKKRVKSEKKKKGSSREWEAVDPFWAHVPSFSSTLHKIPNIMWSCEM